MAQALSSSKNTIKTVKKLKAKPVFERIVIHHLKNHFGHIEKHTNRKYLKLGDKIVRPYYYTDPRAELFITVLSENVLKSLKEEGGYLMGANYCFNMKNAFTIYFVHPSTFQKYYLDAEIIPRKSKSKSKSKKKDRKEWHVEIKHKDNYLILYRKGAEEVLLPVDDDNYYVDFRMSDEEYKDLLKVLPKERHSLAKKKVTLKVVVAGDQGQKIFKNNSSIIIALLSVLAKSDKALKMDAILSRIVQYGVLTRASDTTKDIQSDLDELVKTGAISVNKRHAYRMMDSIKVDVIL